MISSVRPAAAAKVVRLSSRAPPVVIQAACTPNCSARSIAEITECYFASHYSYANHILIHLATSSISIFGASIRELPAGTLN